MSTNFKILFLIILGLIIRLILASLPGFKFDVDVWAAWAYRAFDLGLINFYSNTVWTNYTPGYIYILYILGAINKIFSLSPDIFYFLLKLPAILSELALATLVFKIAKEKSPFFISALAASLVLFNPAFIFNSSIWGQIDGLLSLLLVLVVYFLNQKKLVVSSVYFGLAFLVKPQAIAILPVFGLFLIKNLSVRNTLQLIIPFSLVAFLFSLPFFISQPLWGLPQLFSKMVSDYPYISLFAYNFWGSIGFWIPDSQLWNNLSYQTWGYILLASYWIMIGYFYFKKKLSIYALATLATLGFFFLPTRVHERYLYPAIVFLVSLVAYHKSRLLLVLTAALSMLHLFNLYYVYVYYNEFYLKLPKILYNPLIYNFLDINSKGLSLFSTIIFILISAIIIKYHAVSKEG